MDQGTLVEDEIKAGAELVQELDRAKFSVQAAFWYFYPEAERWRLVIAGPRFRDAKDGSKLLRYQTQLSNHIAEMQKKAEESGKRFPLDVSQVQLVDPEDTIVTSLARAIRVQGLSNVRFSRNIINGVYIDDAVIYRTAA